MSFFYLGLLLECIFHKIQRSRSPEPSAAFFELLRSAPDRLQNIFAYWLTCPFYEHVLSLKFLCHLHEQAEESHSLLYWTRHWPRPPRSLHLQPRFNFPPYRQKWTTLFWYVRITTTCTHKFSLQISDRDHTGWEDNHSWRRNVVNNLSSSWLPLQLELATSAHLQLRCACTVTVAQTSSTPLPETNFSYRTGTLKYL